MRYNSRMTLLVLPSEKYMQSYLEAVKEFQDENNPQASNYGALDVDTLRRDFGTYVRILKEQSEGKNLPPGYVPATEFWIIEDAVYAGRIQIRHTLNDYLLDEGGHVGYNIRKSMRRRGIGSRALVLGLKEAVKLGITRVLITCDEDNFASRKIIEKNGGVLEDVRSISGRNVKKCRFWIDASKID